MDIAADVRSLSKDGLYSAYSVIPQDLKPSDDWLGPLPEQEKIHVYRACLIPYLVTIHTKQIVPHRLQLQGTLATLRGKDSVVYSGCGTGKTLFMVLPLYLRSTGISLAVSPLKRLQSNQVRDLFRDFGVEAIAINSDTPNDDTIWTDIRQGKYRLLIVSPEQLGRYQGHITRFARLLQEADFVSKIKCVHVDEGHKIYTDGLKRHDKLPFRPMYGALDKLKAKLSRHAVFQVLSATLPEHVLVPITKHLAMPANVLMLRGPLNRRNLAFATCSIRGTLNDLSNLDFLVPTTYNAAVPFPKTVIFVDNTQLCSKITTYLNGRLPPALQNGRFAQHYHSHMSPEYLGETNKNFSVLGGNCRILVSTSGQSHGINVQDIKIVIQYGICGSIKDNFRLEPVELFQRGGRAARDGRAEGLFLFMAESWAFDFSLPSTPLVDPDIPVDCTIKNGKRVKTVTVCASTIKYLQSKTCLRAFWSNYLGDRMSCSLNYTTHACCDRHDDRKLDLATFFPGFKGTATSTNVDEQAARTKRKRSTYRDKSDRAPLVHRLQDWRRKAHEADQLRAVRPPYHILSDEAIVDLSKTHPSRFTPQTNCSDEIERAAVGTIIAVVGQTSEWAVSWGEQVLAVIKEFDQILLSEAVAVDDAESSEGEPLAKQVCLVRGRFEKGGSCRTRSSGVT